MFNDRRKIQLIKNLLKVNNDDTLKQIEIILSKSKKGKANKKEKLSAHDFVGCLPKEDAEEMSRIIEEGCGRINYNDWK